MSESGEIEILLVEDNPDDVDTTRRRCVRPRSSITSKSSATALKATSHSSCWPPRSMRHPPAVADVDLTRQTALTKPERLAAPEQLRKCEGLFLREDRRGPADVDAPQ